MKRVMVTGSRTWTDDQAIKRGLVMASFFVFAEHRGAILVSGACARGADRLAEHIASAHLGWTVEQHPANWDKFGKRAGILRNDEMLDSGVDLVVAFQAGRSKGTEHAINGARGRGIPVFIWSEP